MSKTFAIIALPIPVSEVLVINASKASGLWV